MVNESVGEKASAMAASGGYLCGVPLKTPISSVSEQVVWSAVAQGGKDWKSESNGEEKRRNRSKFHRLFPLLLLLIMSLWLLLIMSLLLLIMSLLLLMSLRMSLRLS